MKLSTMLALTSSAVLTLATPVPEPKSAADSRLAARQIFNFKIGGGANFNPSQIIQVNDNTTPNSANPYQTFGSFDTFGATCHCYTGGGANVYSQPFSGQLLDVKNSFGDYWFYNCKYLACW